MGSQLYPLPPSSIGILFAYCLAILSTVVRLVHRLRRQQLWWDDFWAFIAMLATIFVVVVWLYLSLTVFEIYYQAKSMQSFVLWSTYFTQPTELWATRLSIATTVIRLLPSGRNRLISQLACVVFVFMWLAVIIQRFFLCGYPMPYIPWCKFSQATPILSLVVDFISDLWLVCWPAYILLRMKLPSTHRRLLLVCFSASVLVLAISIWHSFNVIRLDIHVSLSGHLDVLISLLVCNLIVLVTYVYRVVREPVSFGQAPNTDESGRPITLAPVTQTHSTWLGPRIQQNHQSRSQTNSWSLKSINLGLSKIGNTFNRNSQGGTRTQMSEYRSRVSGSIGPLTTVDTNSLYYTRDLEHGQRTPSSVRTAHLTSFDFGLHSSDSRFHGDDEESASRRQDSILSSPPRTPTAPSMISDNRK